MQEATELVEFENDAKLLVVDAGTELGLLLLLVISAELVEFPTVVVIVVLCVVDSVTFCTMDNSRSGPRSCRRHITR